MKQYLLAIVGAGALIGFSIPALAQVEGSLQIINESGWLMCEVYITAPDDDFNSSPELLGGDESGCIGPGQSAYVSYYDLSDCYAIVDIYDENGNNLYTNGIEVCSREHIVITDDDVMAEEPEVIEEESDF
jgi:hypothetical protein